MKNTIIQIKYNYINDVSTKKSGPIHVMTIELLGEL